MLIARNKLNFWGLLYECFVHFYSQLYVLFNNSFLMHCGRYNGSVKQWAQWLPQFCNTKLQKVGFQRKPLIIPDHIFHISLWRPSQTLMYIKARHVLNEWPPYLNTTINLLRVVHQKSAGFRSSRRNTKRDSNGSLDGKYINRPPIFLTVLKADFHKTN